MEPQLEILLRTIVRTIVRFSDPLIVNIGDSATLTVQVDGVDMGRCVGKGGQTIWAIQSLLWYAGLVHMQYPYKVRLIDPVVKTDPLPMPLRLKPDWNRDRINHLCDTIILSCVPGHASYYLKEEGETGAVAQVKINKYLEGNMTDPSFIEAFGIVLHSAGLSNGVLIRTEGVFV